MIIRVEIYYSVLLAVYLFLVTTNILINNILLTFTQHFHPSSTDLSMNLYISSAIKKKGEIHQQDITR